MKSIRSVSDFSVISNYLKVILKQIKAQLLLTSRGGARGLTGGVHYRLLAAISESCVVGDQCS